ncbi:MAG: LCP family protein [Erysipelotrichaceae bacterium]|nr:LCP family protein [Erysipelotrichaceae bacterium]
MGKTKKRFSWIKVVYFAMTLLLIAGLFYNRILPDWISNMIKIGMILLMIVLNALHTKKLLLVVLSILMFISSSALFYSQYSINRLINQENMEIDVVTFVVLKESTMKSIDDLKDRSIGFPSQMDETLVSTVKEKITEKVGTYTVSMTEDDMSNLNKLYTKSIDVMILDNSVRDSLIEFDPSFETKTKTIYTLKKSTIKEDTSNPVDTAVEPFIVLISGVDTRASGAVADKARSDVNILMVINPKKHEVLTISIPRDTYTPLGCRTGAMDKLTHSGIFGVDCTIKTIENLFSLDINYYVKVNFTAFLNIVKVLGTIDVYSKYAFKTGIYTDPVISYSYKVGMNPMNAQQALFFARERHAFETSDVQRGLNQQEVIKGMINKVIEPSTLLKIEDLVSVASKSVVTNMPIESVMNLVQNQISNNQAWTITTAALTGRGDYQPTYSMGSKRLLYVSWPDQIVLEELKTKITTFMTNPK